MKCFNHVELDAVATCQRCGKGLCHDCAAKHTPCYCDECFGAISMAAARAQVEEQHEYRAQQQDARAARNARKREALIDTNKEMIKAILFGLVAYAIGVLAVYFMGVQTGVAEAGAEHLKECIPSGFPFFFIPFGWSAITWVESKIMPNLIVPIWMVIIYNALKLSVSVIIGIPMFLVQIIKWIVGLIRASATK